MLDADEIKKAQWFKALFFCLMMVFFVVGHGLCQEGLEQAAQLGKLVIKLVHAFPNFICLRLGISFGCQIFDPLFLYAQGKNFQFPN